MATALRRPVNHEDRLSLIEHLDELRSRLIVVVLGLLLIFGVCVWQNGPLLEIINKPLDRETQKNIEKGRGPLGQVALTQAAVKNLACEDAQNLRALASPSSKLPAPLRAQFARRAVRVEAAISKLPDKVPGNKPVTLGVGEPFSTTLTVSAYFALLIGLPLLLYHAYAFVLPAFSPKERRVALPLLTMIPVLFILGVVFSYFVVLPAAVRFLQNFNADQFNVLVQAKDYYKFAALTLGALGLTFQVPVGILVLTRLGVVSVAQLRSNRRYAVLGAAVIAMVLPGTDPVTMLLCFAPLYVLYELSIVVSAVVVRRSGHENVLASRWSDDADDDDADEHERDDDDRDDDHAV